MAHLTEDDLILHYYGELTPREESRAAEHVAACRQCHEELRQFQRVLALVDDAAVGGELPEGYERTLWARLEPELDRRRPSMFGWIVLSPARLGWTALVVLLVSAAFFAGRLSLGPAPAPASADAQGAARIREAVLFMDLIDHLDRSHAMLVELASAGGDGLDVSRERERAEDLVAANRLYRQTAADAGDRAIVAFLEDLERLLVEVSAGPDELSAEDAGALRRRIEAQDLLFKLRVITGAIRERQQSTAAEKAGTRSSL